MSVKPPLVPADSFLLGNLKKFIHDPLIFMEQAHQKYGDAFRLRAGNKKIYVFSDPEDIKSIFKLSDEILLKERGPRIVLGKSLLTSEGEDWKRQREHSKHFFARPQLQEMHQDIRDVILAELKNHKGDLDLRDFCVGMMYKLVVKVIFNAKDLDQVPALTPMIDELIMMVRWRASQPIKLPFWVPIKKNRDFNKAYKSFETVVQRILSKSGPTNNLMTFLRNDKEMSQDEFISQALTFFIASFETTANSLFWTLYLILTHEEVMHKIEEEAASYDPTKIYTLPELFKFKWTYGALNESLRLYPPAWFRSRFANSDCVINGKHFVPKGSTVWASIYLVQKHQTHWKNAESFSPERFINDDFNRDCFIPFGGGKNICIGKDLAYMELLLILLNLFKSKEVKALEKFKVKVKAGITLSPEEKFLVQFKERS